MRVIKRNGQQEDVQFDKILFRVKAVSEDLKVDPVVVSQKVVSGLYDGIKTTEIDTLLAETAAVMATEHPDYSKLASRVAVSNLHKQTRNFYQTMKDLYKAGVLSADFIKLVKLHGKKLEKHIDYTRDLEFSYFAFKTLEKSYLLKIDGKVVERIAHLFMRVAVQVAGDNFDSIVETYDLLSKGYYTHATPTLFNSGMVYNQLSSCYLLAMESDSLEGIFNTLKECSTISKYAGGIGMHVHNIRAKGAPIKGTNGTSNGLVPMLKVFNETARYVDQCFSPNTKIPTTAGLKAIKDIIPGDKVIGQNGETERVERLFRTEVMDDMQVFDLRVRSHFRPVTVTGEHPFWVIKGQVKELNYRHITRRLNLNIVKPEWVSAKDLAEDDLVGFPIPKFEIDAPDLSVDDCRFLGAMMGDGSVGSNTYICGHVDKDAETFKFYESYLSDFHMRIDGVTKYLRFKPSKVKENIYDKDGVKKVPSRLLNLPPDKTLALVRGLLETDGTIPKDKTSKELLFTNTSLNLVESLRYMLLRLGILCSGQVKNNVGKSHTTAKGVITTKRIAYELRIPLAEPLASTLGLTARKKFKFFRHEDVLYSRIRHIRQKNYQGEVYDLETSGPSHTFLTEAGLVHNGGGKRKGSIAVYLEPWHADIEDFLPLRRNTGKDEVRCRDLFLALWIPNLFMERVEADGVWSLMCPHECPGLSDNYGEKFNALYTEYEAQGKYRKQVRARDLMVKIIENQIETGVPYILFKDHINEKSNQKNIGVIKSSNLCCEVTEVSTPDEIAVCNLASLSLAKHVRSAGPNLEYDYEGLHKVTKISTVNLNNVIDRTFYPLKKTSKSNLAHRPIGLGVQGLADVFFLLDIPYDSDAAADINRKIFETIYHAALEASCELAEKHGAYASFEGSPASQGILQFDMWGAEASMYDWDALKKKIKKHGLRNSLLVAPMPTASTAQIFDNNEAFEAQTSNIYKREVLSGEFLVVNKHLIRKLESLDLWNKDMRDKIISGNGSVQHIEEIPAEVRAVFKTVWEISQKTVIDLAADRGAFIDQSQSMNLFLAEPNVAQVNSALFYGWKKGLKTGMYYLRSKPAMMAQKVTTKVEDVVSEEEQLACSLDNPEACVSCSS